MQDRPAIRRTLARLMLARLTLGKPILAKRTLATLTLATLTLVTLTLARRTLASLRVLAVCAAMFATPALGAPQRDVGEAPMRAVLVAGDGGLRVFDNGVAAMAAWLRGTGAAAPDGITRLSAAPRVIARQHVAPASLHHILRAIERLKPAPGQACFVFITSHGIPDEGVALSYDQSVLRPAALDRALAAGCGNAPTVAVVSACYSGSFALPPVARPNRIVLTAARWDRPSFGCGADETYTFFDQCLLHSLDHGPRWQDVFAATRSCVEHREAVEDEDPSIPQAWFGAAVADLPLPGAAGLPLPGVGR